MKRNSSNIFDHFYFIFEREIRNLLKKFGLVINQRLKFNPKTIIINKKHKHIKYIYFIYTHILHYFTFSNNDD